MKTGVIKYFLKDIMRWAICAFFVSSFFLADAEAREVKFELSLDKDRVAIGESAQLGLSFYGTQSMPAPDIGNIDGLDIRYLGPSTMMTVINGQVSSSVTHMYKIIPLKLGKFQLGPFSFKHKGDAYNSGMIFLEVTEEKTPRVVKAQPVEAENLNLDDRIFTTLDVGKPAAYVNELIPVKVKLYVNRLNVSDIQLPVFEQGGFSKLEFKEPKQYREGLNGITYEVLEFNTSIFGTRPGDYKIGPAKIKCSAIARKRLPRSGFMRDDMFGDQYSDSFFDDFFTRYERYPLELKSPEVQIVISPTPQEGRPAGFSGAVGDYQFVYRASPTKVKVGDPVTVKMEINGTGNFNTVLSPKMESTAGFKVYDPQVSTVDHTKVFTQVLIPENELITEIPRASFVYFDPDKRIYRTIKQNPIPLNVEKPKEEAPSQVVGPSVALPAPVPQEQVKNEDLARDIIYIKESPQRWLKRDYAVYMSRFFVMIFFVPVMFLVILSAVQFRRNRFNSDSVYAGRFMAIRASRIGIKALKSQLRSEDQTAFYKTMFEALQNYLGGRLNIPPAGVTGGVIENALMSKEVDPDILSAVRKLFDACDRARFASLEADGSKRKDDIKYFEQIVRYFEKRKI